MHSLGMGRLPRTDGESREIRTWLTTPSCDHQSEKACILGWVEHWWTTVGYVGHNPGSKSAPGKGSSATCTSRLEFKIRVQTAKCHGPQLCLPVRMGISLVDGREDVM